MDSKVNELSERMAIVEVKVKTTERAIGELSASVLALEKTLRPISDWMQQNKGAKGVWLLAWGLLATVLAGSIIGMINKFIN